ncbi:MAG TPA: hypothetical protein VFO73_11460 [Candidatus Limnocylindrales bacterium]|nr:hypothetical protein [Candidatus Limnocylindrales bacterium]
MAFEVRPAAVGRRPRRWSIPAVIAVLGVVAGAAWLTNEGDAEGSIARRAAQGEDAAADATRGVRAAPAGADAGARAPAVAAPARPMPERVECRDLERDVCLRVARAALSAIPPDAPPVVDATVWRSLLCSDDLECPTRYLEDSVPLGSALLRFADGGPGAAVNVVDWQPAAGVRLGPRAWLARWMAEGAGGQGR